MFSYWFFLKPDPILIGKRGDYTYLPFAILSTFLAVVGFFVLISFGYNVLEGFALSTDSYALYFSFMQNEDAIFVPGNVYSFLVIGVYGAVLCVLTVLFNGFHQKRLALCLTYHVPFSWVPFWKAAGASSVLFAAGCLYYFAFDTQNLSVRSLEQEDLKWLGLGMAILLVQTLGEEVFFRSYLLRVWGAAFPYRLIVVSLLVVTFVALHGVNPDIQTDFWFFIILFVITEFLYYWMLFRTGSVMATWGMHWVNNVFAILVLTVVPGWENNIAILTYRDPVLLAGGSYLFDVWAYVLQFFGIAGFVFLIVWKRSPFYLPAADYETLLQQKEDMSKPPFEERFESVK